MFNKKGVFIIAEAGVNHNGSMALAQELVDAAKKAGADAVKFQTFKADQIVSKNAKKAKYQFETTDKNETQYDMLKKLELGVDEHKNLKEYCNSKNILFISSAFDQDGLQFLSSLSVPIFKIPSGEITNLPYLEMIGGLRSKLIMSTGMADIGEIEDALDVLIYSGTLKEDICILHCSTDYPADMNDVNLQAMRTIGRTFGINYGYSDHTLGVEVSIAAVALGARVIEKHFTLDKSMKGPDHRASLEPDELSNMVKCIRNVEAALGNGIKKPSNVEQENKLIVRKSIVALKDIERGEKLTNDNISIKRPGNGISPMRWYEILGTTAKKSYVEDELI